MPRNENFPDEFGTPMTEERMSMIRLALKALMDLSEHERGFVLCWFCRGCNRYVGPGDKCHCWNDE